MNTQLQVQARQVEIAELDCLISGPVAARVADKQPASIELIGSQLFLQLKILGSKSLKKLLLCYGKKFVNLFYLES